MALCFQLKIFDVFLSLVILSSIFVIFLFVLFKYKSTLIIDYYDSICNNFFINFKFLNIKNQTMFLVGGFAQKISLNKCIFGVYVWFTLFKKYGSIRV